MSDITLTCVGPGYLATTLANVGGILVQIECSDCATISISQTNIRDGTSTYAQEIEKLFDRPFARKRRVASTRDCIDV